MKTIASLFVRFNLQTRLRVAGLCGKGFKRHLGLICLAAACCGAIAHAETATPVADKVACAVADKQDCQRPDCVHLTGMIGARIEANAVNRLLAVDTERLLEGFRHRPGRQEWDGEHLGKWMHAATLAWVNTGNAELRAKLDRTVRELLKCQLDDGYMGTYLPKDYWTSWDVWVHKYTLIGLLTYVRYTGNREPLPACEKIGDLLCKTFGDRPGQRDIIRGAEHVGMAPTSVFEPMVLLYRLTGQPRYRAFCEYILRAWEQPDGPHIVSRLLDGKGVNQVGNAKAYEMLSCINGMVEMYRTTGDAKLLKAATNAWQDIVAKRLYITGTASLNERFQADYHLPNAGDVAETCVTVSWLQLNAHLLRLTGEPRFAQQLERVGYNQLPCAQLSNGEDWSYFVGLEGKKPHVAKLEVHCCKSSGPRGIALIPTFAVTTDADGIVLNLYDAGTANLRLRSGAAVKLGIDTKFPAAEKIAISVDPAAAAEFAVKLRIPDWCKNATVAVNGQAVEARSAVGQYLPIKRTWNPGDRIELTLPLAARVVVGDHTNAGKIAVMYGPLVLAADEELLAGTGVDLAQVAVETSDAASLGVVPEPAPEKLKTWPGTQVFLLKSAAPKPIRLIPFASAGMTGSKYQVWLPIRKPNR